MACRDENKAHIGLVDAHAEGDGGADDDGLARHEGLLRRLARGSLHAGMIVDGIVTRLAQIDGGRFRILARQAIDDAGFAAMVVHEVPELFRRARLGGNTKLDIGPVEALHEDLGRARKHAIDDITPRRLISRRREGADGHARERIAKARQRLIFGAEAWPPLRDAMGLIHGDQRDGKPLQGHYHLPCHQPLGRKIEDGELPRRHLAPDLHIDAAIL